MKTFTVFLFAKTSQHEEKKMKTRQCFRCFFIEFYSLALVTCCFGFHYISPGVCICCTQKSKPSKRPFFSQLISIDAEQTLPVE